MQRVIFDASFFLSHLLPDEKDSQKIIQKFVEGNLKLVEPFIFKLEVVNALRYAFASKRIKMRKLSSLITSFQKLNNIDYVYDFNLELLVKLALKFNISTYDGCYLYLAKKTGLKFYTLDRKLKASFIA